MKLTVLTAATSLSLVCGATLASAQQTVVSPEVAVQSTRTETASSLENSPNATAVYLIERIERVLNDALGNEGGDETMPAAGRLNDDQSIANSGRRQIDKKAADGSHKAGATPNAHTSDMLAMDRYQIEEIRAEIVQVKEILRPVEH